LLSIRQIRWLNFFTNFDITFRYRKGKEKIIVNALFRKIIDIPIIKVRKLKDRTFILILSDKIKPLKKATETQISAFDLRLPTDEVADIINKVQGFDLIDLILTENKNQNLGLYEGKLIIPLTTLNQKIFLRTALIREVHVSPIFAYADQNKIICNEPYYVS
jgi:hypothetical protein